MLILWSWLVTLGIWTFMAARAELPADFPGYFKDDDDLSHYHKKYIGCYKRDGSMDMGFPFHRPPIPDTTIGECLEFCASKDYTFAGMQYGTDCLCGHSYYQAHSTSCRDVNLALCAGDPGQICGANDGAVDVFRVCNLATGASCDVGCDGCTLGAHCYMNGSCITGCDAGRERKYDEGELWCATYCDEHNHYGLDCKHSNPNCLEDEAHPQNGMCVFGCKTGFGPFCDTNPPSVNIPTGKCPPCFRCKDKVCLGDGGPTYYDCPLHWQGVYCLECPLGYWGRFCGKECDRTGKCVRCHQETGVCLECTAGLYGGVCTRTCSGLCDDQGCAKETGSCVQCLTAGWYGDICQYKCGYCLGDACTGNGTCPQCQPGYYGYTCREECPLNCAPDGNTTTCEHGTGHCSNGCISGFYASHCNVTCPVGCVENCQQATGRCDACELGLQGEHCDGYCSPYCKGIPCDQFNRSCVYGCMDRFNGSTCESCSWGLYGELCDQTCHRNCIKNTCDRMSGDCAYGCKVGYTGGDCTKRCPPNCKTDFCEQYGARCTDGCLTGFTEPTCNKLCPANCVDSLCGQDIKHCTIGCKNGFTGEVCVYECPEYCTNKTCDMVTRECVHGCYGSLSNSICPKSFALGGEYDEVRDESSYKILITPDHVIGIIFMSIIVIIIAVCIYSLATRKEEPIVEFVLHDEAYNQMILTTLAQRAPLWPQVRRGHRR